MIHDLVLSVFKQQLLLLLVKSARIVCYHIIDILKLPVTLPFSHQEILVHLSQTSSPCSDLRSRNENSSSRGKCSPKLTTSCRFPGLLQISLDAGSTMHHHNQRSREAKADIIPGIDQVYD